MPNPRNKASIVVHIPALLREAAGGVETMEVELPPGEKMTVRQVLERLDGQQGGAGGGLLEALLHRGDLLPGIAVIVDNDHALMGLQAKVEAGNEIRFLPPIVGG